jgi:plasmid maintenance system antidote protein VapI
MPGARTEYERFESSDQDRRILRQEELILEVTEAISALLKECSVSRTELAHRLGRTKGFVSQLLDGNRNLTLRTISDVCDALKAVPRFTVVCNDTESLSHSNAKYSCMYSPSSFSEGWTLSGWTEMFRDNFSQPIVLTCVDCTSTEDTRHNTPLPPQHKPRQAGTGSISELS